MTATAVVPRVPNDGLWEHVNRVIDGIDLAPTSRVQYKREIRPFIEWLGSDVIHPSVLLAFKRHLHDRADIGTGTKSKYLTVARVFLRELYLLHIIPIDVTAGVRSFRMTRPHKRAPITDDDLTRIWGYFSSDDADPRARVIIGLMYYQGLRRVEVGRLRVEDFNPDTKTLLVWGKGRDDKEAVDVHPSMAAILNAYLRRTGLKSGPLFPSPRRRDVGLSSNMVYRLVVAVHRRLGITKNVHAYRKAFTSRLIDAGMNLLEVQSYTRHKDVSQLEVYYDRLDKTRTLGRYYRAVGTVGISGHQGLQ